MPRPKQRTPQLREHVLRTAVSVLADEGVSAFTARRVAEGASTSVPALYELFGDKCGLVREVFFEGFRLLGSRLDALPVTDDARADVLDLVGAFRRFVRENPVLAAVMFSRPFADFDPGPEEVHATGAVRGYFVGRIRRCVDEGVLAGNETDIAHVLLALAQGLAVQEAAGWLGSSAGSRDRRWRLAFRAALDGLAANPVDHEVPGSQSVTS